MTRTRGQYPPPTLRKDDMYENEATPTIKQLEVVAKLMLYANGQFITTDKTYEWAEEKKILVDYDEEREEQRFRLVDK